MRSRLAAGVLLTPTLICTAAVAGCAGDPLTGPEACAIEHPGETQRFERQDVDLLLVMSSSPSMVAHQDSLDDQLAALGRIFDDTSRFRGRLRVGVVSADLGMPGMPGCTDGGDGARLRATASGERFLTREILDDGALDRAHAPMEDLLPTLLPPPTGCPVQQPLEVVRRVLDGQVADNAGFLRDRAQLEVVLVTDADDASPGDVAAFVETLQARSPTPGVHAAYVAPAPRIDALLDVMEGSLRGTFDDLVVIAAGAQTLGYLDHICLPDQLDLDDSPGLQVECTVEQRFGSGPWGHVPACDVAGDARPCWRIAPEPLHCRPYANASKIIVDRPHAPSPPGFLATRSRCLRRCD